MTAPRAPEPEPVDPDVQAQEEALGIDNADTALGPEQVRDLNLTREREQEPAEDT